MKCILITGLIACQAVAVSGQLLKKLKVRQSMETADQREEPAQFQVTAPSNEKASFLFNAGVSLALNSSDDHPFLSKVTAEYHRNTALKKEQNNIAAGYGYTFKLATKGTLDIFSVGDIKYTYNRIDSAHSLGGNILFTWLTDESHLHWNANNFYDHNKKALFLSIFAGGQYQEIFASDKSAIKGFILRPLYTANVTFSFTDPVPPSRPPIVKFSILYTGRYDVINSSGVRENYTNLLKTGVDWFIVRGDIKVSLGVSYITGSDPMQGLKQQSYWLFSLNFLK